MKSVFGLSLICLMAQGCGQLSTVQNNEANKLSVDARVPEKDEIVVVDSLLALNPGPAEKDAKSVDAAADKGGVEAANAELQKKLSEIKTSSALEKPSHARVTFELLPEKGEVQKSLNEKIILEEKFPEDVSKASIESKASLKLRHERSYKVLVEQLKDKKVLQTTTLTFEFKKKSRQKLEIATSQLSGVMLRYGKASTEVMRECPAGQFMSGVGFNDIPICRAVEAKVVAPEAAKLPAPASAPAAGAPEEKAKPEEIPVEKKAADSGCCAGDAPATPCAKT